LLIIACGGCVSASLIINDVSTPDSGTELKNVCDDFFNITENMVNIDRVQMYHNFSLDLLFNALSNIRYTLLGFDISLFLTIKSIIKENLPFVDLSRYEL
jgi:hypothetical protein